MRLLDLDPHWYCVETDGPRVGLTFLCPHCQQERLGVAFHQSGHEAMDAYIRAHFPDNPDKYIWTLTSGEDFSTLTLTPSVDCSKSGHWHGFITDGNIT